MAQRDQGMLSVTSFAGDDGRPFEFGGGGPLLSISNGYPSTEKPVVIAPKIQ